MNPWRALWHEPRPAVVPPRGWRDWALVAVLLVAALTESIVREEVIWRPLVTIAALAVIPLLLWRRSHPLATALTCFGVSIALQVAQLAAGIDGEVGLYVMGSLVIFLYALVRWGSGREIVVGVSWVLVTAALAFVVSPSTLADVIGGSLVLFAVVADGAAFRYRADVWTRQLAGIRSEERVRLARELHDTVAHHVSAIAVQAQAGRTVAETRPEVAVETLRTIEGEASRTLAEMRGMVRMLREAADDHDADYAPQPGLDDLPSLADHTSPADHSALAGQVGRPLVRVSIAPEVVALTAQAPPALGTALYRLAQESLTNARRHARGARRVDIDVSATDGGVRLVVTDDGDRTARPPTPGFGLIGMRERAQLLGGTLVAGPRSGGGWVVTAELPVVTEPSGRRG